MRKPPASWTPKSLPKPPTPGTKLDQLTGEIIDRRHVLLESIGPDKLGHRYLAYDMERLVRFTALVSAGPGPNGVKLSVADLSVPPPMPPAPPATPPTTPEPPPPTAGPVPVEVLAAEPPPPPPLIPTPTQKSERIEAAWFARCAQLEEQQEVGEVNDYFECQASLEHLASRLTRDSYRQFALETGGAMAAAPAIAGPLQLPADPEPGLTDLASQLRDFCFGTPTRTLILGTALGLLLGSLLLV